MVQQNFSAGLLFNGKVGDVNTYSVILVTNSYVSPGTHLVKNIESQSRNIKSQVKKKSVIENAWAFV